MLVVRAVAGSCALDDADLTDKSVRDLPSLLRAGDALVFNDTRVIAAALSGVRIRDGREANVSFNLTKRVDGNRWKAFARPAKRLDVGDRVRLGHDTRLIGTLDATVSEGRGG
jgi:S-adenosylmethionine:tRNA ribosyltransferase-isomerase